ncbi:ABC transporter ATP-binding protein [Aneurinibacillus migulanus]|uniref:ABC transporter ATP-binding protein n=1 Tax=Aneurinibacillus migulanus TaxID=47500 RepID=UPI002E2105C1|nr:ABC transporter ATP-binding protein [Aneurinibacillus migulanus]
MSSDSVVICKNISKVYQIYKKPSDRLKQFFFKKNIYSEFVALDNININVKKGSTVGIIGRNGSGKSTLLQIIAGTLSPTSGKAFVSGRVSALLELGAGFNPEFTGRENVFLNASILGIKQEEIKERFNEITAFAEIGDFIDRPVKTYSSGMFVRLAFSVATLTNPEIVIIDEALSVGDEKFQRKCYNHLESLKEKGCTILFVSHSMRTVEQICDYAYLLESGSLLGEGEPKEVIDQYHARLYAQENEHVKTVNINAKKEMLSPALKIESKDDMKKKNDKVVRIEKVHMFDRNDNETYIFHTNQLSKIRIQIDSDITQEDLIVGIRIRTTHGVEVYGTSTAYHDTEIQLGANKSIEITFLQNIVLVAGTYHLSVAVAKKIGKTDMVYLDKVPDVLLFKVEEMPITGTGIANLKSTVEVLEG